MTSAAKIQIEFKSHGAMVKTVDAIARVKIMEFTMSLRKRNRPANNGPVNPFQKQEPEFSKPYASVIAQKDLHNRWKWGFLTIDANNLISYLKERCGYRDKDISVIRHEDDFVPAPLTSFKMHDHYKPRNEHQDEAINFAVEENKRTRVLHADTGFGKTFSGFKITEMLGVRTAFIMQPVHIETWIGKAREYSDIPEDKMIAISGTKSLKAAMDMGRKNIFNYDFVFISAATLREFIKSYENEYEHDQDYIPEDLTKLLGIGFIIRDEAHEALHALIVQTIYMSVRRVLYLSGTIIDNKPGEGVYYSKVFPPEDRYNSPKNSHIAVLPVFFNQRPGLKIRSKGFKGYSHITYEKSILKKKKLTKSYFSLFDLVVSEGFIKNRIAGTKMLIFCSMVDTCEKYVEHLATLYPNLKIGSYTQKSPESVLEECDIIVTTPKSCGTGKDIPGLAVTLLTVAIGTEGLSRQIIGRLRPIKGHEDVAPKFFYLVNEAHSAHLKYHRLRKIYMMGRTKAFKDIRLRFKLNDK